MAQADKASARTFAVPAGESPADAVRRQDPAFLKGVIAARLGGKPVDLYWPLGQGGEVELIVLESEAGQEILRHSTAHVMADAVQQLFPSAKVTIGPSIEKGFYYDFDYSPGFTPEDLPRIEEKMQEIVESDARFEREEVSREQALKLFAGMGENYKVELIQELPEGETISLYRHGGFVDLCRGPHLPGTGWIKAFKLTSVAGAYWRGSERNPMLQRIYGTAWPKPAQLKAYLTRLEEAKKRDHRKLGRELDLFSVHEEIGPGLVVYHPKLGLVRALLEEFEKKEHLKRGYHIVYGPTLLKSELWQQSGHYDHYKQNMYFTTVDEEEYGIKPMNCLAHMLIYKSQVRSYRDLPLRYFELGTVHRHEKSGVLSGLFRVRAFTQDDAHILCTPEQLEGEVVGVLHFVLEVMKVFGFEVELEISTRPADSIGTDQDWARATRALIQALDHQGMPYQICAGEGAFYGPKIDIKLKDALDRRWQCATIQCDFTMPERFDLTYVGADGARHRPVMIHRVVLGSMERFLGVLIEHFAGAFPVWLAPVQARLLPITDRQHDFCRGVAKRLRAAGMRVEEDFRNEKLNYKIREAETQKIPFMLVVGDREIQEDGVSPRTRGGEDWKLMKVDAFIARVKDECRIPETEVSL
ncbi:MAG: threonine--tRNA ligase [Deltaproteobacteria bacterium RBG_13_61_14]|nr:MAG: threonine--tRNA ligase [Deltaproteobacteria bacterium RBG_13_61_14]